ncbi:MAG: N-acetylmuramic acid 6-phosphate etherase [Verrucomicrobiota bacterium]
MDRDQHSSGGWSGEPDSSQPTPDRPSAPPHAIGIEGGGTRSTAVLWAIDRGSVIDRMNGPALNLSHTPDDQLRTILAAFQSRWADTPPHIVGICVAGARTDPDRARLERAAAALWPEAAVAVQHDMISALMAGTGRARGLVVISGTGSNVFAVDDTGREQRAGGWGRFLGDVGSGYWIALEGIKAFLRHLDFGGAPSPLGAGLLRAALLNVPDDFIGWMESVEKDRVAALAPAVIQAAEAGDPDALRVVEQGMHELAQRARYLLDSMDWSSGPVDVVPWGGLLRGSALARRLLEAELHEHPRFGRFALETTEGAIGAALFGIRQTAPTALPSIQMPPPSVRPPKSTLDAEDEDLAQALTEQLNPRTTAIDRATIEEALELMLAEDALIVPAVAAEREHVAAGVRLVTASFRAGGRLIYVGAGTSGRLGIVDASECPPTFSVDHSMVQGIIAGGVQALWRAQEGAEDNPNAGALAMRHRLVGPNDTVCGIAASGRTPFVWGALREARAAGASTIMVTCNPRIRAKLELLADCVICPETGPELITGSTRLKAGTATKLVLNQLTTLAMIQIGKVYGNLMVDLTPACFKLDDRSIRILMRATGKSRQAAAELLAHAGGHLKRALVMGLLDLTPEAADARLAAAGGVIAKTLEE